MGKMRLPRFLGPKKENPNDYLREAEVQFQMTHLLFTSRLTTAQRKRILDHLEGMWNDALEQSTAYGDMPDGAEQREMLQ